MANDLPNLENYTLTRLLGSGEFGRVYEGKNKSDGSPVAVKRITGTDVEDLTAKMAEANLQIKFTHTNIVKFHDAFIYPPTDPHLWIIMELCGKNLRDYIHQMDSHLGIQVFLQILDALCTIHAAGVIHRDLKPENIFVVEKGKTLQIKIGDFGLSKQVNKSMAKTQVGTPLYMAPEQNLPSKTYDDRVDIWSLGVILIQLLIQIKIGELAPALIAGRRNPQVLVSMVSRVITDKGLLDVMGIMICDVSQRQTSQQLWDHYIVKMWREALEGSDFKHITKPSKEKLVAANSVIALLDLEPRKSVIRRLRAFLNSTTDAIKEASARE